MQHPALKEALKPALPKHHCCCNCIKFWAIFFLSRSDASQTFKERGPAACQVITTSLPSLVQDTIIGCQRYQPEPAQLFPTLCETIAAIVGACSLSLSAWQVRIMLRPCHLQRASETDNILRAELFQTLASLPPSFAITHLHLVKSVMLFKSIMSTDCYDWYWREGK